MILSNKSQDPRPSIVQLDSADSAYWLQDRLATNFGEPNTFVPRGFEAYARILHPIERDRPQPPETWETIFLAEPMEFERELVSWKTVAAAEGKRIQKFTQSSSLSLADPQTSTQEWFDSVGWRYSQTIEGDLEGGTLARVAAVLANHTSTPYQGVAAIWEGWGAGTPVRYSSARPALWGSVVARGAEAARNLKQILNGSQARLELPGRSHRLFAAGVLEFADLDWMAHAPWGESEEYAQSPSILWPQDHTWVLVTEVDYDSTIIAGSMQLIDALLVTDGLEVFEVGSDIEERLRIYPDQEPSDVGE